MTATPFPADDPWFASGGYMMITRWSSSSPPIEAYYVGITGAFGLLTIALVVGVMVHQIRAATLSRNGVFGIRTPQTQASEEAWQAGHLAAVPLLRVSVVLSVIAAVALVGLSVWLSRAAPASAMSVDSTAVQVAFAVVVLVVLAAAVKANRAAREVNSH
jgi:uncharacterized membrane protein